MSNTFINPTVVAKEALMQLENNCVMGNLVYRGYESEWAKTHNGWKPGATITIKAPVYARVQDGAPINVVDVREEDTSFTLNYRKHIAFKLTSEEMTYTIDKFSERIIQPAMVALGNYIDSTLLGLYSGVCNQVGTPGTTPNNYLTFALAASRMTDHAVPLDGRSCVITPTAKAYLTDHLKGLFNEGMVSSAIQSSKVGRIAGFDMYESQNVQNHTCGTSAGLTANAIDLTVSQGAITLTLDNAAGDWDKTLTAGDIFTAAATYAVNPISGAKLPYLRQFVAASASTDSGTEGLVSTIPGVAPWQIYSEAAGETELPYQTIYTLPTDGDLVVIAGTASLVHPVNLAFHRNALGLCMVPLEVPPSVSWKSQMTKNGYSVRVIRDYDVQSDVEYIRFDVLFGVKVLNPFMACRIAG